MSTYKLQGFEGLKFEISADNDTEAAEAAIALEELLKHINAKVILKMQKAIQKKSAIDMISVANSLIKK